MLSSRVGRNGMLSSRGGRNGMLSSRGGRAGMLELPGAGPGGPGGGSTWLISRRQFNIYEVFLFESQVFGSSYKELRHPAITW